jgi:hypothetical protein
VGLAEWLSQRAERRNSVQASKQLDDFLIRLKGLDDYELGFVAACTADACYHWSKTGVDLLQPGIALMKFPGLEFVMSKAVITLQNSGQESRAPGAMVWAHTVRAEQRLELRFAAKEMWRHVRQGFPFADDAAYTYYMMTRYKSVVEPFLRVPAGFDS